MFFKAFFDILFPPLCFLCGVPFATENGPD
jgi:hypothetical protein